MRVLLILGLAGATGGLAAAGAQAAELATWRNQGQPIYLDAGCSEEGRQRAGLDCSIENPCPLFLELSDVESNANRILLTGNLHTGNHTLSSILLVSEDAGRTWAEAHERIPGAGLEDIQFFDFKSGWVAGQNLEATARDPFLLVTTDGGKTWRRRPIDPEPRTGFIEKYYFDSAVNGYLWIDRIRGAEDGMRYELYESMTGGESWMLREVSDRPIPPKRRVRPLAESAWRVRAEDGVYSVENQTGSGWQTVARFAVEAGACAPEPPAELAPPPEPVITEEAEAGAEFRIPTSRRPRTRPPSLKQP